MGKYADTFSGGDSGGLVGPAQAELNKALGSATGAIASSPELISGGKYAGTFNTLQDIASGEARRGGGPSGFFGSGIGKVLEGAGYVLGLPVRTATSVIKEGADIVSGEGASLKDLVTQPFKKDFYPSTIIPKTGNKWIDVTVGLGADILLDPVTYVAPTAVAGRAQRLALAAKAGEAANIAKAPSLANKVDDIVRYGEWALDDVEREILNVPKGLRWQFGAQRPVFTPDTIMGRASGRVAQAIGKPFAEARALVGDIPALNRVQAFVRPKSYAGSLNALGRRGQLEGIDVLREVSRYSASIRGRAEKGLLEQTLLGDNQDLLARLEASPYRNTVYQVIEGTADRAPEFGGRVVSAEERLLADEIVNLFGGARAKANEFIQQFNTKRGVNAYEIGMVEDYFHGSLTPEAQNYVSNRNFGKGRWDSEIGQTLDVTPTEFVSGPAVMRGRRLGPDEEWLGRKLVYGDKAEINAISRDVLGFDWFKTDALDVVADYIDAVGKQAGRIAFVDRLFDYGDDIVGNILYKMVPDTELVRIVKSTSAILTQAYKKVANTIDNLERGATAAAEKNAARAEAAIARGSLDAEASRALAVKLAEDVAEARKALTLARSKATRKSNEIRKSFETVLAPLEARVAELENLLASGASREEIAATVLKDLHVRAFPDMDDALRPTDYAGLSRDIKEGAVGRYNARMAELGPIEDAGGDVTRQVGAAKGQFTKTTKKVEEARAEIKAARASVKGIKGKKGTLQEAKKELARQKRIMEDAIKNDPAVKNLKDVEAAHVRAVNAVKTSESVAAEKTVWENTVKPELQAAVDSVRASVSGRNFLKGMPETDREAGRIITQSWLDNADNAVRQLDSLGILTASQRDAWDRVLTSMRASEVDLATANVDKDFADAALRALNDPESPLWGNMVKDVREGWTAIEKLGVQLPQETADILFRGIDRFTRVEDVKQFLKIFNRYNQFFRVTAMLTPGFVVRNAYTAAFNNFVYGVTVRDTREAIAFATNLHRYGINAALDAVPSAERALYETAYRGVIASGAGQIKDISTMPIVDGFTGKILNSRLVKTWGTANADAEVGARMAMALRAAKNGDNIDQIATTIARYHFDYGDLSKLDEIAKVFVPFWTFASRNIPLQIMNQIARPSLYRAYESARRNMPVDESMILPVWLAERKPLGFGSSGVLNPDLPFIDMESQIRQLSDPLRLLSQLYPQYKLPIELAGNRQLSLGIPFSEKPEAVSGPADLPALLVGLLTGQAVDTAEGPAISSKIAYAVPNALPSLALLQRLIPQLGGPDKYGARQVSSIVGAATGFPYRQVTEEEQARELTRRQFALRDYLDSLRDRGYLG